MTALVGYLLLFLFVGVFFVLFHLMLGKLIRPSKPDAEKMTIYECGEPTIGSAWIQFDLRFYVVALLFVIFDVEVAFFFPWAVVFGTANQLASQDMPHTPEAKQQYAKLVRDLVPPYQENKAQLQNLEQEMESWSGPGGPSPELQNKRAELATLSRQAATRVEELRAKKIDLDAKKDVAAEDLAQVAQEIKEAEAATANLSSQVRKLDFESTAASARVLQERESARRLAWLSFWDILVFFGVLLVGFAYLWKRGDLDWVRSTVAETTAPPPAPAGQRGVFVGGGV